MKKPTVPRETLLRAARSYREVTGGLPNAVVVPPATAKGLGASHASVQKAAAKILGALGGRSGRGAAKRRAGVDYVALGKRSAGWQRRKGRFYSPPANHPDVAAFVCGADGNIWAILRRSGTGPCRGFDVERATSLPRGARLCASAQFPRGVRRAAKKVLS